MKKHLLPLLLLSTFIFAGCNPTPSNPGPVDPPSGDTETLKSISIHKYPTKTEYFVGDYFEPAGLSLDAEMSKSGHQYINYVGHESEFTFNPGLTTALKESDVKVTLTYQKMSLDIPVTVIDKTNVRELSIRQNPTKVEYQEGDYFDPTGLVLAAITSANKSYTVSYTGNESDFSFSPSLTTALTTSNTKVKVTYQGVDIDIEISVVKPNTGDTETYTVDFNSSYVAKDNSGSGNDDQRNRFDTAMLSYVNHDASVASSLNTTGYVQIYSKTSNDVKKLMVCSKNLDGSVNITFTTKLVSLKVYAQAHYSAFLRGYDSYDDEGNLKPKGYIVTNDNTANIVKINNQVWDLDFGHFGESVYASESEAIIPEIKEKVFNINSQSLTISGEAGERTFICKLEFTVAK